MKSLPPLDNDEYVDSGASNDHEDGGLSEKYFRYVPAFLQSLKYKS